MDPIPTHAQEFRAKVASRAGNSRRFGSGFRTAEISYTNTHAARMIGFSALARLASQSAKNKGVGNLDTKPLFHLNDHLQAKQNQQLELLAY
jgi:hypothetical protein